ncbi:hypothetical protein WA026_009983 [Henosepilachna vigintioctopunctata]|uniref:Glucose-methanol-choline oxidoreductase N-terminal domain-containing protein n=1 Tax=Henosepilachna vigintioctopunctata TaxID=420089 RepID=A0AAW1TTA8_9CUCU
MFILIMLIAYSQLVYTCNEVSESQIDYLESLIDSGFQKSKTYNTRTDNSDFFPNGNINEEPIKYGMYDFIVVGAGSSGSVVSSRLSEVEKWNILLLEAGDFDDDFTQIPYTYTLLHFSERNWGYFTTPQKNGCFGKKFSYPLGLTMLK